MFRKENLDLKFVASNSTATTNWRNKPWTQISVSFNTEGCVQPNTWEKAYYNGLPIKYGPSAVMSA